MKTIFEEMGGIYRQVGDYFIPNITLPDDGEYQIGKYGRMRRSYLKEYRKILYNNYVLEGTLVKHTSDNKIGRVGFTDLFCLFAVFFDICHKTVEITLICSVLQNTKFFKFTFCKRLCDGSGHFAFVM